MDVQGKRVVIMGLGSFSGGVAAARFLARRGARVVVTDLAGPAKLQDSLAALSDLPIEAFHLNGHWEPDFQHADLVIASPAVREDNHFLQTARAYGAAITTEMNLFFSLCPAHIVGVTGSNGKSTTAAMIHAMLSAAGHPCWLGGNIGRSLLEQVDEIHSEDTVVLELSSFQLEDLIELGRSPHTALITTFTPNHLDRHPSLDAYRYAKQSILRYQSPNDLAILNADDVDVKSWPTACATLYYGLDDHGQEGTFFDRDRLVMRRGGEETEFPLVDVLRLPGVHNLSNVAAAACCALSLGADPESIRAGLGGFRTLAHRLEPILEVAGRWFYDDSIATTPESTLAALESIDRPIWLIAGGHDKGVDLSQLVLKIAQGVEGVALIGQTAPVIEDLLRKVLVTAERGLRVRRCEGMEEAVGCCFGWSRPGDVILLSPACASFGMFQNFVHRARAFREATEQLRWLERKAG